MLVSFNPTYLVQGHLQIAKDRGVHVVDGRQNGVFREGGGPVGLSTLSVSVGEETDTVEDVYEPYLLQLGLLMRTPRGRVATPAAWLHLGLEAPPASAGSPDAAPGLF